MAAEQFRELLQSTQKGQEALQIKNPDFIKIKNIFRDNIFAKGLTPEEANENALKVMGGVTFEKKFETAFEVLKGKKQETELAKLHIFARAACVGLLESGNLEAQNAFKTGLYGEAAEALPQALVRMESFMMPYLFNDPKITEIQGKYNKRWMDNGGALHRDDFVEFLDEIKEVKVEPAKEVQKVEMTGALETTIKVIDKKYEASKPPEKSVEEKKPSALDVLNKLNEQFGVEPIKVVVETPPAAAGGGAENGGGNKSPKSPDKSKGPGKNSEDDKYEKMFENVKNKELKKALIELEKTLEEMQKRKNNLNTKDVEKLEKLEKKLETVQPKLDPKNRDDLRFLNNSLVEIDAVKEHAENTGARTRPPEAPPGPKTGEKTEDLLGNLDEALKKINEAIVEIKDPELQKEFKGLKKVVTGWKESEERDIVVSDSEKKEAYLAFRDKLKGAMGEEGPSKKEKDIAADWIKKIAKGVTEKNAETMGSTVNDTSNVESIKDPQLREAIVDLRKITTEWEDDPAKVANKAKIDYLNKKLKELSIHLEPIDKKIRELRGIGGELESKYMNSRDEIESKNKKFLMESYDDVMKDFTKEFWQEQFLKNALRECRSRIAVLEKATGPSDGTSSIERPKLDRDERAGSLLKWKDISNKDLRDAIGDYYDALDAIEEVNNNENDPHYGELKYKLSMDEMASLYNKWRKKIYAVAEDPRVRGADKNYAVDLLAEIDSKLNVLENRYDRDYWNKSYNSFRLAEAEFNPFSQGCLDGTITPEFMTRVPKELEGILNLNEWKIWCELRNRWLNAASNKIKDGAGNKQTEVLAIAGFSYSLSEMATANKVPRFQDNYEGLIRYFFEKSYHEPHSGKNAYFLQFTEQGYRDFLNKSPQEIKRDLFNLFKNKKDADGTPWVGKHFPEEYFRDSFNAAWNLVFSSFMFCSADVGWYKNEQTGKMVRRKPFPGGKIKSWFEYAPAAMADPNGRALNKWISSLDRSGFGGSIGAWVVALFRRKSPEYDKIIKRLQNGEPLFFRKRCLTDFATFTSIIRTDIPEFEHSADGKVVLDQYGMPKPSGNLDTFNRDIPAEDKRFKARMKEVNISLAQAIIDKIPYTYKYPYMNIVQNERTGVAEKVLTYADLNTNWGMKYGADMMKNMRNFYNLMISGQIEKGKYPTDDAINEALQDYKVLRIGGEFADNRPFEANEYDPKLYATILANIDGLNRNYDYWQLATINPDYPDILYKSLMAYQDSWIPLGVNILEILDIFHAKQGIQQFGRMWDKTKIWWRKSVVRPWRVSLGSDLEEHPEERDAYEYGNKRGSQDPNFGREEETQEDE